MLNAKNIQSRECAESRKRGSFSMNEQPIKTTTTSRSTPSQRFFTPGVIFTIAFPTVCFAIALYTSSPYKEWGLVGAFMSVGTLMLYRAIQECIGTRYANASLPYSIATFLAVVPFGIWETGIVRLVAYIVYGSIIGVTGFYWIVWVTVDEFKKNILHR